MSQRGWRQGWTEAKSELTGFPFFHPLFLYQPDHLFFHLRIPVNPCFQFNIQEGNLIASGDIDLAPYDGTGVVVEMRYSFDTNEGWNPLPLVPFHSMVKGKRSQFLQCVTSHSSYNGLEVYNLVNLVMEKEQTVWRLEALDNEGNLIASGDIDLAPYDGTGVVVVNPCFQFNIQLHLPWPE